MGPACLPAYSAQLGGGLCALGMGVWEVQFRMRCCQSLQIALLSILAILSLTLSYCCLICARARVHIHPRTANGRTHRTRRRRLARW